jgi:hypothetical protein
MWLATAANTSNVVLSNGRVGINCNNPQYTLDVNGSVNFTTPTTNLNLGNNITLAGTTGGIDQSLLLSNNAGANTPATLHGLVGTAGGFITGTAVGDAVIKSTGPATQRLWFTTQGSANNMILSNGFVGINSNNPLYTLDVNGNVNITSNLIAPRTIISSIGVNCNTPSYTLDVNGLVHTSSIGINTAAGVRTPGSAGGNIALDVNGSARSAVLYSNHTAGGTIELNEAMYGVYFNITTSAITGINGSGLSPSNTSNFGKYFVFRNNTGADIGTVNITNMTVGSAPLYSNASMTLMNVGGTYALF